MRKSSLIVLVCVLLVLQSTVFTKAELWGVRPDSIMIMLVYVSLGFGAISGAATGFVLGLAQLVILSSTLASLPLAYTIVGFLVGKYCTKITYESVPVQALIVLTAVVVADVVNFAWADASGMGYDLLRWSLPSGAYSALVAGVLVGALERVLGLRVMVR